MMQSEALGLLKALLKRLVSFACQPLLKVLQD